MIAPNPKLEKKAQKLNITQKAISLHFLKKLLLHPIIIGGERNGYILKIPSVKNSQAKNNS